MSVQEVMRAAVPRTRMESADRTWQCFEAFVDEYGLGLGEVSTVLYLTARSLAPGTTGHSLRRELAQLDLIATNRTLRKPSEYTLVREFLRGLHKRLPLDAGPSSSDPLYFGHVRMLAHEAVKPTLRQLRQHAFLLAVNASGMRMAEGLRVGSSNVRFAGPDMRITIERSRSTRRTELVTLSVASIDDALLCPVRAMRRLIAASPTGNRPLFSEVRGGENEGLRDLLRSIGAVSLTVPAPGRPWCDDADALTAVVADILRPRPVALRDRALLLLAHLGALTNEDVIALRAVDVQVSERGLVIALHSRPLGRVAIARGSDPHTCAVGAWEQWDGVRRVLPGCANSPLAFPRLDAAYRGSAVDPAYLSTLVATYCQQAWLEGHFTFTSLRFGFIRSALREGVPKHEIAMQAGLRGPSALERHEDRENLLTGNVALLTGL